MPFELLLASGSMKSVEIVFSFMRTLYVFIPIIVCTVIYICCVTSKVRFQNSIYLVAANISLTAAFLCSLYSVLTVDKVYESDIWFNSADIYSIDTLLIALKLSLLARFLTLVTVFFLIRGWINSLKNSKCSRDFNSLLFLIFASVLMILPLSLIKDWAGYVEQRTEEYKVSLNKNFNATEEMTIQRVKENPDYWGSHYLRAQFLWYTSRNEEASIHYNKAFDLLEESDVDLRKFISERLNSIKVQN